MHRWQIWLDWIGIIFAAAIALTAVALSVATVGFLRQHSKTEPLISETGVADPTAPLVTVLKPLKGFHHDLATNLASLLNLEGVPYEVLIGVGEDEPAISASPNSAATTVASQSPEGAIVQQFLAEHPHAPMRLIFTPRQSNSNPKIINLMGLEPHIRGELVLISDGSTRAHSHSLKALVATFDNPKVGWAAAPCFVRGSEGLGTRLRGLFIGGQLAVILCGTYCLTGVAPIMGSWLAIRRQALIEMGGFAALSPFLAEDGAIGPLLSQLGWKGAIIPDLIDLHLGDWELPQAWAQAVRWGRLFRLFSLTGPLVLLLLNGTFWLILAVLFWATGAANGALALAIAGMVCWVCNGFNYLQGGGAAIDLLLLPLSDLKLMLVVVWSYVSNRVIWRGEQFQLGKDSQILEQCPIHEGQGNA